jgi:hypothetical protein
LKSVVRYFGKIDVELINPSYKIFNVIFVSYTLIIIGEDTGNLRMEASMMDFISQISIEHYETKYYVGIIK